MGEWVSIVLDADNLTPNPFPSGKGNRMVKSPSREGRELDSSRLAGAAFAGGSSGSLGYFALLVFGGGWRFFAIFVD